MDFAFDWRGMLSTATYKNAAGTVVRTDAYQIDLGGFFKRVTKTEGSLTQYVDMQNDSTGRVLSETTSVPGLATWTVGYQYDSVGRLATITSPYGYDHQYTYDDRNRVADIHLNHSSDGCYWVADYEYLGTGNNVRRRLTGDSKVLTVTRDVLGRLSGMATPGVGDYEYAYDAGNRVSLELRSADSKGDAYWYDGLGRLKKATRDSVDPKAELSSGGTGTIARAYRRDYYLDGDSHRTQTVTTPMTGAAETVNYTTHGQRHHYSSIQAVGQAAVARTFDVDGRLTSHGARTYTYDAADNLTGVQDGSTIVGKYGFDALGRRVSKTDANFGCYFVYAGPWMIEDYHRPAGSSATWQMKGAYVHGPGIDNVVMARHRDWVDEDSDTDKVEPANFFYHHNRMGSVMALTGPDGSVVEQYRYDEYGKPKVLDSNGTEVAQARVGNSFLYTGREYDWETGLYHYRARAYDPATGSFLQEDPLGMHDGVNVVAYVNANPINLSDPYGTDGVGEMIDNIISFINENRGLIAGLIMDLLGPLEGILDLISAATGKDISGWLRGGMSGEPEAMGIWSRACTAAAAAVTLAAGAINLIPKLKKILDKISEVVDRAASAAAGAGRQVMCKMTGGCFLAGTLVAMGDGSFVPIESVEAGASVQCEVPAAMPGGASAEMVRAVTDAGSRVYEGAIITVVVERDGKTAKISGTPEHPFWCVSRHQWVAIGELTVGDRLDGGAGDVLVVGRAVDFKRVAVFNFTVNRAHSYRVSELGVLVHNEDSKCWTIYEGIDKDTNLPYVGRTSREPEVRWAEHGDRFKQKPEIKEQFVGTLQEARQREQARISAHGQPRVNLANRRNEIRQDR